MPFRNRFALLLLPAAVLLAGCFQQAGTAMQEPIVTNQAVVVPPTAVPLSTVDNSNGSGDLNPTSDNTQGQGEVLDTPTFDVITNPGDTTATSESGDTTTGNTDTTNTDNGTNPPVALTIISATLPPIATDTPAEQPTGAAGQIVDGQGTPGTSGSSQFITPSGPLGPITPVPVVPATVSGDTGGDEGAATPSGLITPTAFSPVDETGSCTHTVQSGDTLYRIALKYQISVGQLQQANPQVTGTIIQPGDVLNIPNCNPTTSTGGSTTSNAPQATSTIAEQQSPATALPSGSQTYVVKRGDTLYTIGLKFGVSSASIQQANNISNPDRISPGQELIIPAKSP